MKTYILMITLLFTGMISAQDNEPKLEAYGEMVKATYFHDNGKVQQEGFFKEGKLHGQWVSYDVDGNKKAVAEYKNGAKLGQWIFWNGIMLSEVQYVDSRVASVKNWKQEQVVQRN